MSKEANPIPQGKYVPATRFGDVIFTAGMTPRNNGVLIKTGKIGLEDAIEDYNDAVRQAAKNALTAAEKRCNTCKEALAGIRAAAEQERIAAERAEQERIAAEAAEQARIAAEEAAVAAAENTETKEEA